MATLVLHQNKVKELGDALLINLQPREKKEHLDKGSLLYFHSADLFTGIF
jgi:hypothetical protein